jgi:CubicO group peptidase (beta-lactamase class C family)
VRSLVAAVILLLVAAPAPAHAQIDQSAQALSGLWYNQVVFTPEAQGALTVRRSGAHWRASIRNINAIDSGDGDELRFHFGEHGDFRGKLNGDAIEGFWIQPMTQNGSAERFATPLTLRRNGATWSGDVKPVPDTLTLYLDIFTDTDGKLKAAFRNFENNARGGASQFLVTQSGDTVNFDAPSGDGSSVHHQGAILHDPDRIRIAWQDLNHTFDLARASPRDAAGFYPRPPGASAYVYRQPEQTDDGWRTARAADAGIDEAALARAVQHIIDGDPASRRPSLIHSMLVAHRGRLVLEEYFFGTDREMTHDIRSAGKTFGSVMLGTAMQRGVSISPDTHIYPLLSAMGPFANPDPRKDQITLTDLMTHTAGLECNDNDDNSVGNEGRMASQTEQPNWWKYTLDLPMAHDPGQRYAYCSANENLVGAAITTATHTWLPEWFDRTIAQPLQFGRYYWNLMPNGEGYLGGGAFMRPRDLLKLGQAYLDGGVWNGRRIVSADWVRQSTTARIEVSPATTGLTQEEFENFYVPAQDGYAWHLAQTHANGRDYATYMATGNGGQLLIVIPECDLAVVFTGGNYMQGGIWLRWRDDIVGAIIIPGLRN